MLLGWLWHTAEVEAGDGGKVGAALASSSLKHIKSPETIPNDARDSWSPDRESLLFKVIANWILEL